MTRLIDQGGESGFVAGKPISEYNMTLGWKKRGLLWHHIPHLSPGAWARLPRLLFFFSVGFPCAMPPSMGRPRRTLTAVRKGGRAVLLRRASSLIKRVIKHVLRL